MEHLIEFQDVSKIYGTDENLVCAVNHMSMHIDKGEFVAIVGQSGSGKTTCMNIIGCLDVPSEGRYLLNGNDVGEMDDDELAEIRNGFLGFVFQQYNLLPKLTILENVELPLLYNGMTRSDRIKLAKAALERVGLSSKIRNYPSQLSGGQQQRVSIARALVSNPSMILADEPTGALDSRTGEEMIGFLQELNRDGNTIILITHDNHIACKAQRIIRLHDGGIIYDGPSAGYEKTLMPEYEQGGLPS
jgi:putative ABC transport system ATP-binding protein